MPFSRLSRIAADAKRKWERDGDLPLRTRAKKASEYVLSLSTASLYLRDVDVVGAAVRTLGRPRIDNSGYMSIGARTVLRSILVPLELVTSVNARLEIGAACSLNYGVSIGCTHSITIGDRVRMGPFVMVVDTQFHDVHNRSIAPPPEAVSIASDVWIGTRSSVLPGVSIGRGSVIGAHSLVNKSIPPFTIWGGVPAKKLGEIDPDKFVCPEEPLIRDEE